MLDRLRVLELGQVIGGTIGGMILADLGADVIKVERPEGDAGREPSIYGLAGESAVHLTYNRNKSSIALDLKVDQGRDTFLALVSKSDAVIENFRPGVLDRLGVGPDALRRANSNVVIVSVTGFGQTGRHRDHPAYDLIIQALSGHLSTLGTAGEPPVLTGVPFADVLAGMYSAIAVLAGVSDKAAATTSRHFDISMLEVMTATLGHLATMQLNGSTPEPPAGHAHPSITPWQAFKCADGRYIVIAPRERHFWHGLRGALGVPELMQSAYEDPTARHAARATIVPLMEKAFAQRTAADWITALQLAGVPAAPVNDLADAMDNPHLRDRGAIERSTGRGPSVRLAATPLRRMGDAPAPMKTAPALGVDGADVLRRVLDLEESAIDRLRHAGALH